MTTIIALIIVLGSVVFVHELGHFLSARWAGVRVDIFSIGFGKPIVKWHDKYGTEWRIAWLPFGGYVAIYGQEDMFNRKKVACLSKKEKAGHYLSVSPLKQAIIIAAGVCFNIVLAWVLFTGLFMRTHQIQAPVVGQTESVIMQIGDRIMAVDGKNVSTWDEMIFQKQMHSGHDILVTVLRGDKLVNLKMPSGKWGVIADQTKTQTVKYGFFGAAKAGAKELVNQSKLMFVVLKQMIMGERSSKELGGLLTIAKLSGQALADGIATMFAMIALISVNLAVINLFPLPVLDGGYLFILAIEALTGRKIQGKFINCAMRIGWWFLMALMAFALWNDIARLLVK
jgi:regulator of sigma E protease